MTRFNKTVGWMILLAYGTPLAVLLEVRVLTHGNEPLWMAITANVLIILMIDVLVMAIRSIAALIREDARKEQLHSRAFHEELVDKVMQKLAAEKSAEV